MIAMPNPNSDWQIKATSGPQITGDQFQRRVWQFAAALDQLDVRPCDSIALLANNCIEAAVVVMGAMHAGVNVLPLSTHIGPRELAKVIVELNPELLVAHENCLDLADELLEHIDPEIARLLIGDRHPGWESYTELVGVQPARNRTSLDGKLLLTSGGSTGTQKVVEPPSDSAMAALNDNPDARALAVTQETVTLVTGPLYHAMGALSMVGALAAGGKLVIMDRPGKWDPADFMEAIDKLGVTRAVMVPTMMASVVKHLGEGHEYDISRLEVILHGAAPCPTATKLAFMGLFPDRVFEVYSGTEQLVISVVGPDAWLSKPGTVGRPISPVVIRDDQGNALPPRENGVIWGILTTGTPMRYRGRDEETNACIVQRGGVLEGTLWDIGHLDEDGFLFITGRAKDMMTIGGANVYPGSIEEVLLAHPDVADVAVVGIPHDTLGEVPAAAIEIASDALNSDKPGSLREELLNLCRGSLPKHHMPETIVFLDGLRTPTGKLPKAEIRNRVLERC